MYLRGRGVSKDYLQAAKLLQKSAELGNEGAQNEIGDMYENGFGVAQDYAQALKFYTLSAKQGYYVDMISLAMLYADGKGLPRDASLAYTYLQMAQQANREQFAKMFTPDSKLSAAQKRIIQALTAEQIKAADAVAANWKPGMPLPGLETDTKRAVGFSK